MSRQADTRRLSGTSSTDNYLGSASYVSHIYEYGPNGQLMRESTGFGDGMAVTRRYRYNRRGQRTQVADTVSTTGGGSVGEGKSGLLEYYYNATTARIDSMVGTSDSTPIGRIRWGFDLGGRETDRWVRIGASGNEFYTGTGYKSTGAVDVISTIDSTADKQWYSFHSPTYSAIDELTAFSAEQGEASGSSTYTQTFSYATDGTRRLLSSLRNSYNTAANTYTYDVFGNRLSVASTTAFSGDCDGTSTTTYLADNRLDVTTGPSGASPCGEDQVFYHDQAGNRLAVETERNGVQQRVQKMSYTAARQLYFSLTATYSVGDYDVNWHWYDAGGKRVITHRTTTSTWFPQYDPDTGTRTYYIYDGTDVALTVTRTGTSTTWAVPQRFMVGGLDRPLLGRFRNTNLGSYQNLALIGDRQGSTIAAVKENGLKETQSTYYSTDAFGAGDAGGATPGYVATGTGYTGASTPNANGGFVYLRNRWYDPQTGRFLTQDPIGLAGGVNLYAYAGNNPVAFTDPFGLDPDDCSIRNWRKCRWATFTVGLGGQGIGGTMHYGVGSATASALGIGSSISTAVTFSGLESSGRVEAEILNFSGTVGSAGGGLQADCSYDGLFSCSLGAGIQFGEVSGAGKCSVVFQAGAQPGCSPQAKAVETVASSGGVGADANFGFVTLGTRFHPVETATALLGIGTEAVMTIGRWVLGGRASQGVPLVGAIPEAEY